VVVTVDPASEVVDGGDGDGDGGDTSGWEATPIALLLNVWLTLNS